MNPRIVGAILLPLHERIMQRRTFQVYNELQKSQWWSREKIMAHQLARLRELVGVALTQTAAYGRLAGVDPDWRPESLDDLAKLPLLDKPTIRANLDGLCNRTVPGGLIRKTTGGSTGDPLVFYMDRQRQACDKAARLLTHQWWGLPPGTPEAYVWGSPIELNVNDKLKRWRDRLTNEWMISAHDLSETTIHTIVTRMRRFGPWSLYGYPSSLAQMCDLAADAGLPLGVIPVRAIFSTAEVLHDHFRKKIAATFPGAPVINNYGSREGGFIAHECPHGRMHVISEHVIVEIVVDGKSVAPGTEGEIVITHVGNHAMPFIRYRTNDIGRLATETCPCGRGGVVMNMLLGRSNDFILTPDGRRLHGSALNYLVRDIPTLRQYQFIQEALTSIRLLMVLEGELDPQIEERLRRQLYLRLGRIVRFDIERVDHISPSESGKFRYVISKVDLAA